MKTVGCILLGAGSSSRMGKPKLLFPVAGRTVFEIVLERHIASCLTSICAVVAGWISGFKDIVTRYAESTVEFAVLEEPCEMSDSLKMGWRRIQEHSKPNAVMISLADKPLVTPHTIDLLIRSYLASSKPICVPVCRGSWGHPVIIDSAFGEEIMRIEGDQGAKEVLRRNRDLVGEVSVDSDEVLVDLDSQEDMNTVISRLNSHE